MQIFAEVKSSPLQLDTRRLRLNEQSTSIRLENAFWNIGRIADADGVGTGLYFQTAFPGSPPQTQGGQSISPRFCAPPC